jgi:CHAD domain-containing protein
MLMEFALHPSDGERLPRSKLFAHGRPRYRPTRLVWHDTADRVLQSQGLILEERRGQWVLTRLFPGTAAWLPAQTPPVIAQSALLPELAPLLPEGLAQRAMFEGKTAVYAVTTATGALTMTLLRGAIGEIPVCRLTLDGPDAAVRDLAASLAGAFQLTVPLASLAAEAIGIVDGQPPVPRRLGPPRPALDQSVAGAFAHTIGHLTDVLLHYAPAAATQGPDTEPVHQMRVAVRRARSAIAVFRHGLDCPDVSAANRDLKALGAVLGPTRDWDVFVTETLPRIEASFSGDKRLHRLIQAAQARRTACHTALYAYLASPAFRCLGVELAWLCASDLWVETLSPDARAASALPPADFAAHVLQRRWRKVMATGKAIADLDVPALHGLRLRAKQARSAMEIFRSADRTKATERLIRRLSRLQEQLGVLNDGAVAGSLLDELGGAGGRHGYAAGLVLGFLGAAAASQRPRILRAWDKFRRTPRFWT